MKAAILLGVFLLAATVSAKRFRIVKKDMNWFMAIKLCTTMGLELASLESPRDYRQLHRAIEKAGIKKEDKFFWLAGTDLGDRMNFYWATTGKPIRYARWRAGSPDPSDVELKQCVNTALENGKFVIKDCECDSEKFVVCQENDTF